MPGDGAAGEAAQAHPKGTINMPVPCLPKPRGSRQSPISHRHFYPQILLRSLNNSVVAADRLFFADKTRLAAKDARRYHLRPPVRNQAHVLQSIVGACSGITVSG